ncbi:hypothetical protein D3C80_1074500 [compost metagenome]
MRIKTTMIVVMVMSVPRLSTFMLMPCMFIRIMLMRIFLMFMFCCMLVISFVIVPVSLLMLGLVIVLGFMIMFFPFHDLNPMTGFNLDQLFIANCCQNLIQPALHSCTVIDNNIRIFNPFHILRGWLPIMRLYAVRDKRLNFCQIASHISREFIHRIKAYAYFQLITLFSSSQISSRSCISGGLGVTLTSLIASASRQYQHQT